MATLRELKGRIGSVASSEKITGAMKMISSAKMRKAEMALRRQLPYRNQIESIIANLLSADAQFSSPLTQSREINRIAVVVLGSDDGLCGAYNANLCKRLVAHIAQLRTLPGGQNVIIDIFPVGKKMAKAVSKLDDAKINIITDHGTDSKSEGDAVNNFTNELRRRFIDGEIDRVDIMYMNFRSVSRQVPVTSQLLPVTDSAIADSAASVKPANANRPYLFEPDANTIFNTVLPMLLQSTMQEVFTENRASEQAARVMAMQSANDNAKKLLEQLQLEYNKLRQQSITTELLDIVGGQVRD